MYFAVHSKCGCVALPDRPGLAVPSLFAVGSTFDVAMSDSGEYVPVLLFTVTLLGGRA